MSKEYYDSRQSGDLLCRTVLGNKHKNNRFHFIIQTRRAYNSSPHNHVWHANNHWSEHANTPSSLMVPERTRTSV